MIFRFEFAGLRMNTRIAGCARSDKLKRSFAVFKLHCQLDAGLVLQFRFCRGV